VNFRPTYANVTSSLALFLALGGTSYALTRLPSNSVGTAQIRNRAVTPAKLAIPALARGPVGPLGPQGPAGSQGLAGTPGAAGASGVSNVYINRDPAPGPVPDSAQGSELLGSLTLPAGSYAIFFESHAFSSSSSNTWVDCDIDASGVLNHTAVYIGRGTGATLEASISEEEVQTFTSATTVQVYCAQRNTSYAVNMADARLVAEQVDTVTVQ
jgi:hypothetical protein